ncbi:DNA ligase [Streptomyces sp. ISL-98]|uniref:ATP-dependent DNA ligase n=1 Tax=Streptomyces sp. ISL-98 TaxID=2819192 RepID=UPI001BECE8B7|nr:RNA ligase family protein [Streptomyces sp. ISL-98]MBT2509996.1 DNA ligase [Streptomyces sp. ISL-98]
MSDRDDVTLVPPVDVMRPRAVSEVPVENGLPGGVQYSVKLDGFRCVAFGGGGGGPGGAVFLQSRSGRNMALEFPDIAAAVAGLPAGLVLDGEVCAWVNGAFSFVQLMRPHAARVADGVAVSYVAFDVLALPGQDVRELPLAQRWQLLGAALEGVNPQVQAVMATTDRDRALLWYETLVASGVEGLVCKALASRYRPRDSKAWVKVRHSDTHDAAVIGYTGSAERPRALVLVLAGDDDTPVVSSPLAPDVRVQARELLAGGAGVSDGGGEGRIVAIGIGEVAYRRVGAGVMAEVQQFVGRHATTVVRRLRFEGR